MSILKISQETLIQLPDGATGGAVKITYNGTTVGQVIASGDDQGRAVIVSGRLAKLTALDGKAPLQIVGREAGGRMPSRVTLRIYPEYPAGINGPAAPITLTGLPVASPDVPGVWDLSNIEDSSGGLDVVTPAERQSLALLKENAGTATANASTAAASAVAAAQSASSAKAAADASIANLNSTVQGAAQQAAQQAAVGTMARVDGALSNMAQASAQMQQQQQSNNAQTADAIAALGAIPTRLSGLRVTTTDDGYLFNPDPTTSTNATVQAAPLGGLLYDIEVSP